MKNVGFVNLATSLINTPEIGVNYRNFKDNRFLTYSSIKILKTYTIEEFVLSFLFKIALKY
jgi:hypothetical protein